MMDTSTNHDLLSPGRVWLFAAVTLSLVVVYQSVIYIYNIRFHPLSKFPGPKSAAASSFPIAKAILQGNLPFWTQDLHQKHGEIVRTAPNALSVIGETAWKDIYGYRQGHRAFQKFVTLEPLNGVHSIISTPSDPDHTRMRRLLAYAFSEKALREQEPLIQSYVNTLMLKLQQQTSAVDIVKWFNYTTFDIIAHLSFGEPFFCLQEDKYHPWVQATFRSIKLGTLMSTTRRFPATRSLLDVFIPPSVKQARRRNFENTVEKVTRRIEKPADASYDFMSYILKHNDDEKGMSRDEIDSTASVLFIAGSETTATLLSGMCYHLLKNPAAMARLNHEVRGAFETEKDITNAAVEQLPYLMAVLQESLRVYPPTPAAFERIVPEGGDEICGQWVPGGTRVGVSSWAINHSPANFQDPDSFVPERWLDEDPKFNSDRRSALNPFSTGPRNCIGKSLAQAEMKIITARLLWNFDLQLSPESEDWAQDQNVYLFWEKPELNVRLTPRTM